MERKTFEELMNIISKLKPHEWKQVEMHVNKKYSSKLRNTPLPSYEELIDVSPIDLPCVKN